MAERRFAALAQLRHRGEEPKLQPGQTEEKVALSPEPPISVVPSPVAVPRPPGRPPGKRSDPEWKPRTILMRTKTHRRVSRVLLDRDDGPDLSELIDELLDEWVTKQ
jgi:hypothetical protein